MASHSQSASLLNVVHPDSDDEYQSDDKYLKFKESDLKNKYRITSLNIFKVNNSSQEEPTLEAAEIEEEEEASSQEFEHNRINELIDNPGLSLIATQIFEYCDPNTLKACRKVNLAWKEFIDAHRFYYSKQIELLEVDVLSFQAFHDMPLKGGMDLSRSEPWTKIIQRFKHESIPNMKLFIHYMIEYYGHPGLPTFRFHPLHYIFIECNVGFLKLILPPDSPKVLVDEYHRYRIEIKYKQECTIMILQRFESK